MIAYVETRLRLVNKVAGELAGLPAHTPYLLYLAYTPDPVITEVNVLRSAFDGEPPEEIIITVTPA